ncbi:hypothetical protein [Wolbachia endosymbiont (group A) of Ancistrocerus nigricornis]|uniref:hypothetical protein n=1 Tax=Wolbachia endosymbiont (group A) of Ancistrocerus nigricornis TaxID=2953974 RepID=UPI002226D496|nr:hypothetical protein [Wolbachia endosymbiont (group A) of Ancistrocerus nigricornis]
MMHKRIATNKAINIIGALMDCDIAETTIIVPNTYDPVNKRILFLFSASISSSISLCVLEIGKTIESFSPFLSKFVTISIFLAY